MKKNLIITASVLMISLIIFGVIFVYNQGKSSTNNLIPTTQNQSNPTPTQQSQRVNNITSSPIFDYWMSSDSMMYTINQSGQIQKQTPGAQEVVSTQIISALNRLYSAPDGNKIIARFNYPQHPIFSIFLIGENTWEPLPQNTLAAAWSLDSKKIIYLESKNSGGMIKILDLATRKTQDVVGFNQRDVALDWIKELELLITINTPSIDFPSSIWSLNLKTKALKPIIREESGLSFIWSKENGVGLKLTSLKQKPILSLIDENFDTLTNLSFVTLPEKCVIAQKQIFCAVPQNIPDGTRLPDDYYKKAVYFQDNIYRFDLTSGGITTLLENNSTPIDAMQLSIKDGKELFFINRYDSKLYSLPL